MAVREVLKDSLLVEPWTILSGTDGITPVSGLTAPTDVTLTLQRESSGTIVAAGESVTMTEIGSTGRYYLNFTPANTGLYILYGLETATSTMQRAFEFRYAVISSGSSLSVSYSDAYCNEADIERWLQQGISTTTSPDDTETANFAKLRADYLTSICTGLGFSVSPSTVDTSSVIGGLLREANAIGGAIDYTLAQHMQKKPSLSERADAFQARWIEYVGGPRPGFATEMEGIIQNEIRRNLASLASCHTISGDTTARSDAVASEEAIGIGMGDTF